MVSNSIVAMFRQIHTSSCHTRMAVGLHNLGTSFRRLHEAAPAQGLLPVGLRADLLPRHVAVVMDGNTRWARARGLPQTEGHEHMRHALKEMVRHSRNWGIRALTAFAFSNENWNRPKLEVDFLMDLIDRMIQEVVEEYSSQGIRLRIIGDFARLPLSLQNTAREAEQVTRNNSQLDVIVGVSYSGRWDMVQACRNLAQEVQDNRLNPEDIDESLFAKKLHTSFTHEFPYPDLLIRTSGELRLSNFLLWQTTYSELFFTNTLWPDFGEADYIEALASFQSRHKRFGWRRQDYIDDMHLNGR